MVTVEHGEQIAMTRVTCGHTALGCKPGRGNAQRAYKYLRLQRYLACADADQRDPTDAGRMTQGGKVRLLPKPQGEAGQREVLSLRKAPETVEHRHHTGSKPLLRPAGQRCPATPQTKRPTPVATRRGAMSPMKRGNDT